MSVTTQEPSSISPSRETDQCRVIFKTKVIPALLTNPGLSRGCDVDAITHSLPLNLRWTRKYIIILPQLGLKWHVHMQYCVFWCQCGDIFSCSHRKHFSSFETWSWQYHQWDDLREDRHIAVVGVCPTWTHSEKMCPILKFLTKRQKPTIIHILTLHLKWVHISGHFL